MGSPRGGTKIPFWNPGYRNKPGVNPPGLLRLASALALLSAIGTLIYAVFVGLLVSEWEPAEAIYIACLHFLLPIGVTYTVSTNNRASRFLILLYGLVLGAATLAGRGVLGGIGMDPDLRLAGIVVALVLLGAWLFGSPRMRLYYGLLSGAPLPPDLAERAGELISNSWPGPRTKRVLEWVADHLESLVLVGFIVLVIYALLSTSMR